MTPLKKRLLILSCAQRKKDSPAPLPAMSRYDGPAFGVVRKFLRENPEKSQALDVYIISAEYGFIPADFPIRFYDRRMERKRAEELRLDTIQKIKKIVQTGGHRELFVNLGRVYLTAIAGLNELLPIKITSAQGSNGGRLSALQKWLYEGQLPNTKTKENSKEKDKVKFRGVGIDLSREEILEFAKNRLTLDPVASRQYQAWYVQIDNECVSPKWLVNQLTGLPLRSFHSREARQVLESLGIRTLHL